MQQSPLIATHPAPTRRRRRQRRTRGAVSRSLRPLVLHGRWLLQRVTGLPGETIPVIGVVALAALWRIVALGTFPAALSPAETTSFAATMHVTSGWGPGLFGTMANRAPSLPIYLMAPFVAIFAGASWSLRLLTALITAAAMGWCYLLARRLSSAPAAAAATVLIATNVWFLSESRLGQDTAWLVLTEAAALETGLRATERHRTRDWILCAVWCALSLYGNPAGRAAVPLVLLLIAWRLVRTYRQRPSWASFDFSTARGGALALALTVLLITPQLIVSALPGAAPPASLPIPSASLLTAQRPGGSAGLVGFISAPQFGAGLAQQPRPLVDAVTLALVLVGLLLGLRKLSASGIWYASLAVAALTGVLLARSYPGTSWGLIVFPPLCPFVGLACDHGSARVSAWLRAKRATVLTALVCALGLVNSIGYAVWESSAATTTNGAALPMSRFVAWRQYEESLAVSGHAGLSVAAWLATAPLPAPVATAPRSATQSAAATGSKSEPPPFPTSHTAVTATFTRFLGGESNAQLVQPEGVAVNSRGTIYVADPGAHTIVRYRADGHALGAITLPTAQPAEPWDLAAAPDGSIVACDAATGTIWRLTGSAPPLRVGTAAYYRPRGITVAPDGLIYVAVTGNNLIAKLLPTGQQVGTIAAVKGKGPLLDQPTDVAIDVHGDVFVAEPDAGRIEKLSNTGALLGSWRLAHSDTLHAPHLATIAGGTIAATVPTEHRVLFISTSGALLGTVGTAGTGAGQFDTPVGIATDPAGTALYVTDSALHRVAVFTLHR